MTEHIKIPYLNVQSVLLSGQVLHRLIQAIQLFCNLQKTVPVLNTVL